MRQKNWTYLQKCQTRKKKTILLSSPLDGSRSHLSHLMWMWISLSTTEVSEREKSKRALVNVCKCTKKGQARAPSLCANWKMSKVVSNRQGRPPPPLLSSPFACGERKFYAQTTAPAKLKFARNVCAFFAIFVTTWNALSASQSNCSDSKIGKYISIAWTKIV